jgi:hypothetical protein
MKLAAAIAAIEETRVQVGRKTMELRKVVEESLVADIRDEIGEKGASWNIDLADDPKIKPLLDAGEDMRALFEEQLDEKGRELTFMGNARVAYRISRGGGVANMCSTGPIREGIDAARALLLELADDDSAAESGVAAGAALQPDPRSLDDAISQIGLRFTTAKSIEAALRKSFSTETIDRVARATKIKKVRFQFPSEDGLTLGKPTLITTQTSISLERIVAGIFRSFLAGARTRAVQPAVIAMIAEQVDPGFAIDAAGGSNRRPSFTTILKRASGGIQANREMQSAFIYAICAVAEYASQYWAPEADNIGPTDILSRGRSALQDILAFHAMGTRFPNSKYASDIRIAPGADPESWIKKFVRSAKYPGTPAQKLAALKQAMREKQITTFKVFPYVEFEEEDALTSPTEETDTDGKRGVSSKIAMAAIKKLIDGTAKLAAAGMKSKAAMTKPDRSPDTRGVGHLSLIALCDRVALVVNQSRRRGIGKLLMLMGYSAPDSLLLGSEKVTGQMVWERMCDRASVPFSPQPTFSANFDQFNYNAWRTLMTGSNKLLAQNFQTNNKLRS